MKTYIINLPRHVDRLNSAKAQLNQLGLDYRIHKATDCIDWPDSIVDAIYDAELNQKVWWQSLVRAEIGCFLSHYRIWKELNNSTDSLALILEDDLDILCPETLLHIIGEISKIDNYDFDMLKFQAPPHPALLSKSCYYDSPHLSGMIVKPLVIPLRTVAYIITQKGARKALRLTMPFGMPVDQFLARPWLHNLDIICTSRHVIFEKPNMNPKDNIRYYTKRNRLREGRKFFLIRSQRLFLQSLAHRILRRNVNYAQ